MSVNLDILSNFSMTVLGKEVVGQQGDGTDGFDDVFTVSVNGERHIMDAVLATATAVKVWDNDTHKPTAFQFLFIVADQAVTIQVVGSATNFSIKQTAGVPFVMTLDNILAAANTTDISGTEPTWEDIDHVVIQNNSGNDMNYFVAVIN